MDYSRPNLKWNGWGWRDHHFDFGQGEEEFWADIKNYLNLKTLPQTPSINLEQIPLPHSKISQALLESLIKKLGENQVKSDRFERICHGKGKSFYDLIRMRQGKLDFVPDVVVYPLTAPEVEWVVKLAQENNLALIPFGGGSSVVGGVEATRLPEQNGIITLDTTRMNRLLNLDEISFTATFQPGIYGPELEEILQGKGYTLGHYPQSFQFSTLGGWIAARGAGNQSDRYGKAEEFLVAAKVVTPQGEWRTLPFPASAAGPDLNHLIAGSEGILGVITEITVKIHSLPKANDYRGILFRDFKSACKTLRCLMQDHLPIAMVRISDADETNFLRQFKKSSQPSLLENLGKKWLTWRGYLKAPVLMLLGLEGDRWQVYSTLVQTLRLAMREGGFVLGRQAGKNWYQTRFEAPYLRDALLDHGIGVDTVETATAWGNIHHLHETLKEAIHLGIREGGHQGLVMSHISHSYANGASLYFTFLFPLSLGNEMEQWLKIKEAACNAIVRNGGTISHHHGIGMDHAPWLKAEKGALGIGLLKAAKAYLDPNNIMNPGKIL